MSARLVYSQAALADLVRVWDEVFDASADVETTDAYLDGLRAEIRTKAHYPLTGHRVEYAGLFTGFYWVQYKAYLAFYRVHDDRMEVARIQYERRDYLKALFGIESEEGDKR